MLTGAVALAMCLAGAVPAAGQYDDRAPFPPPREAPAEEQGDDADPESPAERTYPYETEIAGLAPTEEDLQELLRRASQLVGLADRPPPTEAALRRRAQEDMGRLRTALQSEGFYDAQVDFTLQPAAAADQPAQVTVQVDTGTVYLLEDVEIAYQGPIAPEVDGIARGAEDLGLQLGMRARAPEIQRAQRRILESLENQGYPAAEVTDRSAVVDRDRKTMRVSWQVDPGSLVRFGDFRLRGLETVEEKYVRSFRTWQPGEIYDRRKVEETREELVATSLFDGVQTDIGTSAESSETPVTFTFEERPHRSIGFGARFSTSEGPAGTAFWEHRNAFGQNERVRIEAEAGLIDQRLGLNMRKPRFQRDDQTLVSESEARRHDTDAFEEAALGTTLSLERELSDIWTGSLGGSVEFARITDNEGERDYILYGIPTALTRDTRDSVLNPTEGTRLELATTPYLATLEETQPFLRGSVGGSAYYAIGDDDRFVLAGRGHVGSIVGAETEQIPASKRFYAGGGGSIRGFPFEEVGPLDAQDDPLGGRSIVELSLELRMKVTETIGVVPFIDAGNVYDTIYPDFSIDTPLRYGAGLGLRYYTTIGPLRLDVAVPLNKREVDNDFEIYVSLGQSF